MAFKFFSKEETGLALRALYNARSFNNLNAGVLVDENSAGLLQRLRISPLPPDLLVMAFRPLKVKESFELHGYVWAAQYPAPSGTVYAVPTGTHLPAPDEKIYSSTRFNPDAMRMPRPEAALQNAMLAIEGDGTPVSYLLASLLSIELARYGEWSQSLRHQLILKPPWEMTAHELYEPEADSFERGVIKKSKWWFKTEEPTTFKPSFKQDKTGRREISFYTYILGHDEAITRWNDTYSPETGYCPATVRELMARGQWHIRY